MPATGREADLTDRAAGCLLGLCVGGALGRAARAASEGGGGGETVDIGGPTEAVGAPAAFALALAESWVAHSRVVDTDLARRWGDLVEAGGEPPGAITAAALRAVAAGAAPASAARSAARLQPDRAGDGALARALPLAVAVGGDRVLLRRSAYRSAQVTHADEVAAFTAVAVCLLGLDLCRHPLAEACRRTVQAVREDLPDRALAALRPTAPGEPEPTEDDAVGILAAAVTVLARAGDLETAAVTAANHGAAPVSLGALVGGLAGLRAGAGAIPARWLSALTPALRDRCARLAAELVAPAPPLAAGVLAPRLTGATPPADGSEAG